MLRLIHALVDHDDIKSAYLTRHDLPSGRMAIENRNTVEARMGTVWQMMADRWNDPNFLPVTGIFPELHSDFSRPIALNHDYVSQMQVATAEKVEEKWNTMNLRLKRVIDGWEASGQGDGGHLNFDDEAFDYSDEMSFPDEVNVSEEHFGSLKNRSQAALDQRKNFVDGKTYLLYLWQMLDTHDLLRSSMQRLNSSTASGNASFGVPSVVGHKHGYSEDDDSMTNQSKGSSKKQKRSDEIDKLSLSITQHGQSLVKVAKLAALQQQRDRIHSLEDTRRNLVIRLASDDVAGNTILSNVITTEIEKINEEIKELTISLNNEGKDKTPRKCNRSPV